MASHLSNPVTRPSDYVLTWTPQGGTATIIDRGSFNLPGTNEAEEYSYTTDEETLKETSTQAGYSQIDLETVLDDKYNTFMDQALSGLHGVIDIAAKAGTSASGSWSWNAAMKQVSEPSMSSNDPAIPVYTISWSILSKNA